MQDLCNSIARVIDLESRGYGCKSHQRYTDYFYNKFVKNFGPLAQFDFVEFSPSSIFVSFGISEFDLTIFCLSIFLILWQVVEYYDEKVVNKNIFLFYFPEEIIIIDILSPLNYSYNDITISIFSILFLCNFSGLIPYSQTVTAQLIFTFLLAYITILVIWLHSVVNNKIDILNHFLPNGSPFIITPFIILIELISNLSRIISLSVRLFANITSGHALLKILAGFGLSSLGILGIFKLLGAFPIFIVFIITILELLIAFLQTYVFITLILIYVSEQE